MRISKFKGLALLAVVAAATLTGCGEAEKGQIAALQQKNDVLTTQVKDFREQVAELEKFNERLKIECDDKDMSLAKKNEEVEKLKLELQAKPKVVEQKTPSTATGWERGIHGDKISVGSDILFRPGRAKLSSAGRRALSRIANDIQNEYGGMPVRVYGYTDSDPIRKSKRLWKDNLDLSANRAMAVTRYLIDRGVDKENIETVAMGATNFVASNKSKSGKAKNRRVDIVVIRSGK